MAAEEKRIISLGWMNNYHNKLMEYIDANLIEEIKELKIKVAALEAAGAGSGSSSDVPAEGGQDGSSQSTETNLNSI